MWEFLRKFDINSLYICPPYLHTVTTLPWEIQKSHFSTLLFRQISDYYVISEETNCNCCTAAYLLTYCCLLLPNICFALFNGQFLPRYMECRRGLSDEISVRLSVCLSNACIVTKRKKDMFRFLYHTEEHLS